MGSHTRNFVEFGSGLPKYAGVFQPKKGNLQWLLALSTGIISSTGGHKSQYINHSKPRLKPIEISILVYQPILCVSSRQFSFLFAGVGPNKRTPLRGHRRQRFLSPRAGHRQCREVAGCLDTGHCNATHHSTVFFLGDLWWFMPASGRKYLMCVGMIHSNIDV